MAVAVVLLDGIDAVVVAVELVLLLCSMRPLLRAGGGVGCVDARKRPERGNIDAAAREGEGGVWAAAGWLKEVIAKGR